MFQSHLNAAHRSRYTRERSLHTRSYVANINLELEQRTKCIPVPPSDQTNPVRLSHIQNSITSSIVIHRLSSKVNMQIKFDVAQLFGPFNPTLLKSKVPTIYKSLSGDKKNFEIYRNWELFQTHADLTRWNITKRQPIYYVNILIRIETEEVPFDCSIKVCYVKHQPEQINGFQQRVELNLWH